MEFSTMSHNDKMAYEYSKILLRGYRLTDDVASTKYYMSVIAEAAVCMREAMKLELKVKSDG